MQKRIFKAAYTWRLILSLLIVATLVACEDGNTVGGGIIDTPEISVDTIFVDDFQYLNSIPYSGNTGQAPVGSYEDPLFGRFNNISYLNPELIEKTAPLNLSSIFRFVLHVNNDLTYGDTTESLNVDIFQIDEFWRPSEIRYNDELSLDETDVIGSFTYNQQDSLEIELSDSLLVDYLEYYNGVDTLRDSLYSYNFFGIALVPENNSKKIIYPDFQNSRLYSIRESSGDTISIPLKSSGFFLDTDRIGASVPNRIYLSSNLENYVKLNFKEIASTIGSKNILEAQLIFYEDTEQLRSSINQEPGHQRQSPNFLDLKSINANIEAYDLQFKASEFIARRDSVDNSFSFDITNHLNNYIFNDAESQDLYLNINPSGGRLLTTILFDSSSSNKFRPKIVIKVAE